MKQIFTLLAFLIVTLAGFTQGKGKDKKEKEKKEIKSSVPAPANQGGKPEVNNKQKPVIYQSGDTSKAGSFPTQSGSPAPSQAGNAAGSPTSGGSTSGGQTQPTTGGEPTSGQSSGSGSQSQTPSSQTNPPSTSQSGGGAENSKTVPGSKQHESSKDDDDDDDHEFKKDKKDKKDKQKEFKKEDDENGNGNGNSKTRINIPTQVRNSFNRDYPNAMNAVWTKNRGDWTVTFGNSNWNSTATYHSNGERVDTRTPVRRDETPQPVQEEILKRFPQTNPKDIIRIEKPKNPNLFQVVVEQAGKIKTMVFDEKGKLVSQMQDIIK
ncbi:MAG: hypothetical protein K2Q24_13905 [Chitinophagaceae bacterium]|jgi:hypothetical protein|nr:hypothetical protein [Chitinophagaceae bacterium]